MRTNELEILTMSEGQDVTLNAFLHKDTQIQRVKLCLLILCRISPNLLMKLLTTTTE